MNPRVRAVAIVCVAVVASAVAVGQLGAQQAGPVLPKYPIHFVQMHQVAAADVPAYQALIGKLVAANAQHDNGNIFAAYVRMTGGPKAAFYYLYPAEKLSDMESWTAVGRILRDVYGEEEGADLLRQLGDLTGGGSRWLSGHLSALSNLDPEATGTYLKYGYYIHAQIKAGRAGDYAAAVAKLAAAARKNPKANHWGASSIFIGGSTAGPEYGFVGGFNEWAELDDWPTIPEVLTAEYGAEEAAGIMASFAELAEAETHFMALVPELSNLPAAE